MLKKGIFIQLRILATKYLNSTYFSNINSDGKIKMMLVQISPLIHKCIRYEEINPTVHI